jgi:DNA repair protein SbcD/Mre11
MITFFHVADTHFGVENYGKVDKKTGIHSRLLDFRDSFEQCVELAIKEKIDFFLFCGDAYKTAYPSPTQQKLFMQVLLKLHAADIPVVIIVGNHDNPLSFGKAHSLDVFASLPIGNIHVISKPETLTLKTKNGDVQIVGMPWPTRNNLVTSDEHRLKDSSEITKYLSEKVGVIIQSLAEQLNPEVPAVLAGHLTVSNGIFSGSEKCAVFGNDPIFLPSQLSIKPFDYVALGHLHRHQNVNPKGYPAVVYSGSTDRIDFGERKEEKGFCRVSFKKSGLQRCSYEFVQLKTRSFIQVEVKLKKDKDQAEQIIDELFKKDVRGAIIKIMYHLPEDTVDTVDLFAVQRACSDAMHVASILPVRKPVTRERRIKLQVSMDVKTLVEKYLEEKTDLKSKKEKLLEKALELYDEIQSET